MNLALSCRAKKMCAQNLQSWTKVLGTVLQYAYFSLISRFPLKTVRHFRNFLAVLPPPTLYKIETQKKFWILASNIVCGVRGGVRPVWIKKHPRNAKVSQDVCLWLFVVCLVVRSRPVLKDHKSTCALNILGGWGGGGGEYFSRLLDFNNDFLGIQNNLKIHGSTGVSRPRVVPRLK